MEKKDKISRGEFVKFFLEDEKLQALYSRQKYLYTMAIPIVVLSKDGVQTTLWLDETNNPEIKEVREAIEKRIDILKKTTERKQETDISTKTVCEIFCCNKYGDIRYHVNGEQFEGTLISGLEYYRKYLRDEYDHEKKLKLIEDNIQDKKPFRWRVEL